MKRPRGREQEAPAAWAGGGLHEVAVTEDDQSGRVSRGLLRPEAHDTLVDVRERSVAPWHRLAERRAGWQRHVRELRRDGQAVDRPHEPPAGHRTGDDPNPRPFVRGRLREGSSLQIAVLRRAHLFARRQIQPQL